MKLKCCENEGIYSICCRMWLIAKEDSDDDKPTPEGRDRLREKERMKQGDERDRECYTLHCMPCPIHFRQRKHDEMKDVT
jgi:hypothetical protein